MTGGGEPSLKQIVSFLLLLMVPSLFYYLKMPTVDIPSSTFIAEIIRKNVKERKQNKAKKNDFIDFLAEAIRDFEKQGNNKGAFSDQEIEDLIISNGLLLFFAGNDTTSSALSVACHFLAKNQDIQVRFFLQSNF